jgi:MFS family permease
MKYSFPKLVADMSINSSVAGLGVLMLPLAIGALAKAGMSASALGMVAFVELGLAAVAALLAGWTLRRTDPIDLCAFGSLLVAVGNGLSAIVSKDLVLLLICRAVVGVGTGLMYAGGLALVARLPRPERLYGFIGMAPCLSALVGFWLAPYLIQWWGGAGGIFIFQAVSGACTAVLLGSRRRVIAGFVAQESSALLEATGHAGSLPATKINLRAYFGALLSYFLLALCDAAIWTFVAPIGESVGISLDRMGNVLIVAALVGCLGPLLAAKIGARFGLLPPIVIGQALMIGLSLGIVATHSRLGYMLMLYARVFAVLFLQPLYQGMYARFDRLGRIVAASFGASEAGYSLGPLLAGQFISIERHSFSNLGILAAAAAVLCLAVTLYLQSDKRTKAGLPVYSH